MAHIDATNVILTIGSVLLAALVGYAFPGWYLNPRGSLRLQFVGTAMVLCFFALGFLAGNVHRNEGVTFLAMFLWVGGLGLVISPFIAPIVRRYPHRKPAAYSEETDGAVELRKRGTQTNAASKH